MPQVIYSARSAILAGLLTVVIAAIVCALTGLVAGYQAGAFDALMMRLWDTLLAFPAIGIVSVLGPGNQRHSRDRDAKHAGVRALGSVEHAGAPQP